MANRGVGCQYSDSDVQCLIVMPQCSPNQFAFASIYTRDRDPWLEHDEAKRLLLAKMQETKHQFRLVIAAYVVLDDRMHWLFSSPASNECSAIVNHLRAGMQKDWRRLQSEQADRQIWEHGFKLTLLSGKEELRDHLDFIHYEPVRLGLTARPVDYKWSSLAARVAEGHFPENWGVIAPPAAVAKVLKQEI